MWKKLKKIKITKLAIIIWGVFLLLIYDIKFNYVSWQTANRDSAHIAPLPSEEKEAVVQVYVARTYNWRGYFAVHPWIAIKKKDADSYTTYQVTGWSLRRGGNSSVWIQNDIPDRNWYGRRPILLQTLIGAEAESAIPKIESAVKSYPYSDRYTLWPGPNSNTFVSYVMRNVPELKVELPSNALGKDFLGYKTFFAKSETGTGYQISFWGLLGITLGLADGIEINILSMVFGVDVLRPALKLPMIGRLGLSDAPTKF